MTVRDFYNAASTDTKDRLYFIVSYVDEDGDFYNVYDPLDERVADREITEWSLGAYNFIIHCW